jgi:Leucine-rich repeat (LRR) protein
LASLDLAKNEVKDITAVSKLAGLMTLKLSDNKIEDISAIQKKNQLKMLFLERNKVTDLSSLVTAAQEDAAGEKRFAPFLRLYLADNPLSDTAKSQQLSALKAAGVRLESAEGKPPASSGK